MKFATATETADDEDETSSEGLRGTQVAKTSSSALKLLGAQRCVLCRLTTPDLPCSLFGEKTIWFHKKIKVLIGLRSHCRAWEATE